ncbi:MAG: hypothetical protein AAF696_16935, partial [Bacteroidota bacterium]
MDRKPLHIGKKIPSILNRYPLGLLMALQCVLLLLAFNKTLLHPNEYMLCNYNDGMRQYFFF